MKYYTKKLLKNFSLVCGIILFIGTTIYGIIWLVNHKLEWILLIIIILFGLFMIAVTMTDEEVRNEEQARLNGSKKE